METWPGLAGAALTQRMRVLSDVGGAGASNPKDHG
jgi:hypothetical protein